MGKPGPKSGTCEVFRHAITGVGVKLASREIQHEAPVIFTLYLPKVSACLDLIDELWYVCTMTRYEDCEPEYTEN